MNALISKYKAATLSIMMNAYHCTYGAISKRLLARRMKARHQVLVEKLATKEKITIVFILTHAGLWKLDLLYKKMLKDPYFNPMIMICPAFGLDETTTQNGIDTTYSYIKAKGYNVIKSRDALGEKYLDLDNIDTDLVFFTSPHKITIAEYYEQAYKKYLSCFAGYGYIAREYKYYDPNLDKWFHQAIWRNYISDQYAHNRFKNNSILKGINTKLTGAVYMEELLDQEDSKRGRSGDERKIIIYAPHYTIQEKQGFKLSNFLELSDAMLKFRDNYKDNIFWIFRPHPLLKDSLIKHPEWGRAKAQKYYDDWQKNEASALSDGDYIPQFKESDAMIHDSGSFLVEYLSQKKPCLYIVNDKTTNVFSSFYHKAYQAYHHARTIDDIELFLKKIIDGKTEIKNEHRDFYDEEFIDLYLNKSPSDQIILDIKRKIKNET